MSNESPSVKHSYIHHWIQKFYGLVQNSATMEEKIAVRAEGLTQNRMGSSTNAFKLVA